MPIFHQYPIIIPFISILAAEVAKFCVDMIKHRDKKRFINSGGMPSGHSAFVSSLVVVVAYREGIGSTTFMIAAVIALIVMYDAITLRYESGNQAATINKYHKTELEESLGHTHWEVLVGVVFGALISFILLVI